MKRRKLYGSSGPHIPCISSAIPSYYVIAVFLLWLLSSANTIQIYDEELARRIQNVSTAEDFLLVFFPDRNPQEVWQELVLNSTLNKNKRLRRGRGPILNAWEMINREMEEAVCQPRDTIVDVYKEFGIPRGFSSTIFPECVLVKRCKNSGCCKGLEECAPVAGGRKNIPMMFITPQPQLRRVSSDTECSCQPRTTVCPTPRMPCRGGKIWNPTTCRCECKRCPSPFTLDEKKCECTCLMSNRQCLSARKGKKMLPDDECRCVKENNCGIPECKSGDFSLKQCRCI
ncbi:vascular endothelial growth factor C-like [Ptychodera flava]|uniref:vascular endothelial growth factor C-like n=1 Tax=Ptychodera flava TaxID=63121 RepID=UPI003969CB14